jgi:phosphoglycerate kinase
MMEQVLRQGTAHRVLTSGLTGEVMLLAQGHRLGEPSEQLIRDKGLWPFVDRARALLDAYGERIALPDRFRCGRQWPDRTHAGGAAQRAAAGRHWPADHRPLRRGNPARRRRFLSTDQRASTSSRSAPWAPSGCGRRSPTRPATRSSAAATAWLPPPDLACASRMGYVCTSGGGMVRFLSGQALPVVEALRRAVRRWGAGNREIGDG